MRYTGRGTRTRTHWEIAVLAFLREDRMHPYEMQRLLRARHKDDLLALRPGSLYHAINRLVRARLIEPVATGREGRRPERTTYRLTPEGRRTLVAALREMVAIPRPEASEFFAGLSFLVYLDPADAAAQLEQRAARLDEDIAGLTATRKRLIGRVQRVNLLEEEYLLVMRRAERQWVRAVLADLRARKLSWSLEAILTAVRAAKRTPPPRKD
jgi:DNA-binding PadR family transcriptional regulator